jgi:hypothetical protein
MRNGRCNQKRQKNSDVSGETVRKSEKLPAGAGKTRMRICVRLYGAGRNLKIPLQRLRFSAGRR